MSTSTAWNPGDVAVVVESCTLPMEGAEGPSKLWQYPPDPARIVRAVEPVPATASAGIAKSASATVVAATPLIRRKLKDVDIGSPLVTDDCRHDEALPAGRFQRGFTTGGVDFADNRGGGPADEELG